MEFVFGVWDIVILALTMIASIGIGFFYRFTGGKQKTNEEYLLADRNMPAWIVAVSLMTSFMSAITLLGVSNENYSYGAQFVAINIGYAIATPIAAQFYLPVFFGLARTSTYEYLELRFGRKLRLAASLTYTLQMILYNGIVLYAPAIVLETVTGLNRVISILLVGFVCTFYSTLGGMKAVLITDVLQSALMYVAMFAVIIFAAIEVGGLGQIFIIASEGGRLDFNNFSPDPTERHTWWSLSIGGMFTYLTLYAVNHTQIQRLLTVRDLRTSKTCIWINWPMLSVLSLSTALSGLAIYSVYRFCDPLSAGYITASDQLMAYYVIDKMRNIPGLSGLFIAGIFSASLSTVSSACNSVAAVTISDYIKPWFAPRSSREAFITKVAACTYGLLFMALAFIVEHLGGVLQAALTIFGAVGGPLLGVFTLGMFTTYANENGTLIGLFASMIFTLWVSFGTPRPAAKTLEFSVENCPGNLTLPIIETQNPDDYFYLYRISYMWTSVIGFLTAFLLGTIMSLLWRSKQRWEMPGQSGNPDPVLFTPILAARMRRQQTKKSDIEKIEDQSEEYQSASMDNVLTGNHNIENMKMHPKQ